MKHPTDCAQVYADRPRLSRRNRPHLLRTLRDVLLTALAVLLSQPAAWTKDRSLLDELLEVEAEHSGLCKAALDAESTRQSIGALVGTARTELSASAASGAPRTRAESAIRTLNGVVFGPDGIRPSQDLHDPCNLLVSSVLAQKQGYCVGVAGVYLILAEDLDLPIRAVATPSHVFLRYVNGDVAINIDPMNQGAPVPDEQYISQQRIAQESIRKGIFLKPMSPDQFLAQVHNNLGVVYSERKDYAAAAREYDEALRLDKHLPAAWYNQGKMLAEQKDYRGAVRSLSKALRLHPSDTWALNNRALAYRELGKVVNARQDLQEALRIDPAFDQARQSLAAIRTETSPH